MTEASPLTYPEGTFSDGSNIVLYRQGNIARRLGIDFEEGYLLLVLDGESDAATGDVIVDGDTGATSDGDALDSDSEQFPRSPDDLEPI